MKTSRETGYFLIWAVFAVSGWLIVSFGIGFKGLYGMDAHEYYRYSEALYDFFNTLAPPGDYFWPVHYPLYGALLSLLTGDVLFSLQCVSVAAYVAGGWYLFCMLKSLYRETAANDRCLLVYLTLGWFLSPWIWRAGIVVMSDMTAVAWCCLAWLAYIRYNARHAAGSIILFGLASAAAVSTRYISIVLLIWPACMVGWAALRQRQWAAILGAITVAILCWIPHFLVRGSTSADFIEHNWLLHWSPVHFPAIRFETHEGVLQYPLPNAMYSLMGLYHPGFGPVVLLGAVAGLFIFIRRSGPVWIGLKRLEPVPVFAISFAVYSLFISGIPYQNTRYLLMGYPLLICLAYPGFRYVYRRMRTSALYLVCTAILLAQSYFIYYYFQKYYQRSVLEKTLSEAVQRYPGSDLYTFGVDMALPSYGVNIHTYNLWKTAYPQFRRDALVLFNEDAFAIQWKDKNPMRNWESLKRTHTLDTLERLPDGWVLFRIR